MCLIYYSCMDFNSSSCRAVNNQQKHEARYQRLTEGTACMSSQQRVTFGEILQLYVVADRVCRS
jgi:hypothetical protein